MVAVLMHNISYFQINHCSKDIHMPWWLPMACYMANLHNGSMQYSALNPTIRTAFAKASSDEMLSPK